MTREDDSHSMSAPQVDTTPGGGQPTRTPTTPEDRLLSLVFPEVGKRREEEAPVEPEPDGQSAPEDTPPEGGETPPDDASEVPAGEEEQPPASAQPPTFAVTVNGVSQQVPLDELVAGYQRHGDYTQKTQALTAREQALVAEAQQVREARERYTERLQAAEQYLSAQMGPEPDWGKLRAELGDAEFTAQYAQRMEQRERLNTLQREVQRVARERYDDEQRRFAQHVQQEQERLLGVFPEWRDQAKAADGQRALIAYAQSLGYTPDELAGVSDHRAIVVLHKAMMFDKLKAEGANLGPRSAQAKPSAAPILKPGAKPPTPKKPSAAEAARQRVKATGRVEDASAFFFEKLKDEMK